jgi:site-specific DNA recombinase
MRRKGPTIPSNIAAHESLFRFGILSDLLTGQCELPYFREQELSERLGRILKDIYVANSVVADIQRSLATEKASRADRLRSEEARLQQRLTAIRTRMDQAYLDKLDGKITTEFWERKNAEWLQEEQRVRFALAGLKQADEPARLLTASRTLELANKAYSLYVTLGGIRRNRQNCSKWLSNCQIDAVNITPTYRKPFDLIFARAKNEEWRPRTDSNCDTRFRNTPASSGTCVFSHGYGWVSIGLNGSKGDKTEFRAHL